MLFRKHIVSMNTLLQLAVSSVFFAGGAGAAFAANSGTAPVIIPYTVQFLAGNEQPKAGTTPINTTLPSAGYGGDGSTGFNATLNGISAVAVDAAGNIFFPDTTNDVIRELNAQTGIINTIAGVKPSVCSGYENTACAKLANGCADGQPALNSPISGNIHAIAVDEYDNVYFGDSSGYTISVVYHGGWRVANFINLVNPAGVAKAGGVIPGYVYHIAGTINLASCVGTHISGTSVASQVDNVLAFQQGQLDNTSTSQLGLDSAGNIYIQDIGAVVVRVINTQVPNGPYTPGNTCTTNCVNPPQQFFQYVVPAGYIRSIVNCSGNFTVACPGVVTGTSGDGITLPPFTPQNPTATVDGPANAATFNTLEGAGTDGYGNVYEVNYKNATPNIYVGVAYAGGAPLAHLFGALWKGVNIAYGDWYEAVNDISLNTSLPHYYNNILANTFGGTGGPIIRPFTATADPLGNIWSFDSHWPSIFREDVNSGIMLDVIGYGAGNGSGYPNSTSSTPFDNNPPGESITLQYGSVANPIYCVYGYNSTPFAVVGANPPTPANFSPTSNNSRGDGCPAILGSISSNVDLISDGFGDIITADTGNNELRWFPLFNAFPATPVGTKVTQPIDIHFDATNQPTVVNGVTGALTLAPGTTDFSIDTTDPEFAALPQIHASYATYATTTQVGATPATNFLSMYSGPPTCIQNAGAAGDASWDCLIYITFDPTAPGLRNSQIVATTANGSVYYFSLTGLGTGGQLSLDGGTQTTVPTATATPALTPALGAPAEVAVASNGSIYIADPANNRIVVCAPGSGSLCKTQTTITGASLVWPSTTTTTTLSGPMGVAVDDALNIYISDTGNNRILEVNPVTSAVTILGGIEWVSCAPTANPTAIPAVVGKPCAVIPAGAAPPANPNIGGTAPAVTPGPIPVSNPLQQYLFKGPEGIAVDLNQNVFVADTGNSAVVMIPKNPVLGGAAALFGYVGGPTFVSPVAVAVDSTNNIYVADTGNLFQQVVKIPPGGGDLQTLLPLDSSLPLIGGQSLSTPSGVAVDGEGNVFISDAASNAVWEAPAAGAPYQPFQLTNLIGLNAPLGLALDSSGGLYVANSGADQVLYVNRQNPMVNFGNVPEDLGADGVPGNPTGCLVNGSSTPCTGVMTVTNSGTQTLTLSEPLATITSSTGPGFAVTTTCGASLIPGATCTIAPTYTPPAYPVAVAATVTLSGGSGQTIALVANGGAPEAKIVLTAAYSGGAPASGGTATYTATVTQPHNPPGGTPTGTVTFTILVDNGLYAAGSCGTNTTVTVPLVAGVASTPITEAQGRIYTVTALYNGDANDSPIISTPLTTTVPGIPITLTVPSPAPYAYGTVPPKITGTITGVDASVTATLVSGASQYSAVEFSPYPITVQFTNGDYCNYGNPSTGAFITETSVPLTNKVPAITAVYGAPNINFALNLTFVGAVNGDQNRVTPIFYTTNPLVPVQSSTLTVAGSPYTINVQFSGKPITPDLDYTPTYVPLSLTIVQAPSTVGGSLAATSELPTAVASAVDTISVGTAVSGGIGIPTGTVTVYDTIIPIGPNGTGLGATVGTTPLAVELPCTFAFTGTTVTGSSTVYVSSGYDLFIGETVTGTGIPAGTTITAVNNLPSVSVTGSVTSGSPVITGLTSTAGLFPGASISGPGIPAGATITSIGASSITLSVNATATAAGETVSAAASPAITLSNNPTATALIVQLIATTSTSPCTTPITTAALSNGTVTFTPSNTTLGLHQFTYAYSGDSNFLPSTSAPPAITPATLACAPTVLLSSCLLVDNKDFFVAAPNLSILEIVPGIAPSGNGLLTVPNQGSSSDQQSYPINVVSVVGQTGTVAVTCLPIGNPYATNFTASTTSGSAVLANPTVVGTGTVSTAYFTVGDPIAGPGIPSGATIVSVSGTSITISSNATATATNAVLSFVIPPPNGVGTSAVLTASTTFGSPVLTAVSSTTGLSPGEPISGAGIPQGATIVSVGATTITMSLNAIATGASVPVFSVTINVTSLASSYITCSLTPPTLTLSSNATSQTVVAISIPLTEPVGYQYFAQLRTPGSETLLAILPLGVLAFCVRRRRKLSKALWMLLAIAAVTVGMSGCGARNQVDFFSPFPEGPQYVQVTATGTSGTAPNAALSRTFLIEIYIE